MAWCDRINGLAPEHRHDAEWHYVLLGEATFYGWRDKGGSVAELLAYARLRPGTVIEPRFGGHTESDELGLPVTDSGLVLPCGATGRWTSKK